MPGQPRRRAKDPAHLCWVAARTNFVSQWELECEVDRAVVAAASQFVAAELDDAVVATGAVVVVVAAAAGSVRDECDFVHCPCYQSVHYRSTCPRRVDDVVDGQCRHHYHQ